MDGLVPGGDVTTQRNTTQHRILHHTASICTALNNTARYFTALHGSARHGSALRPLSPGQQEARACLIRPAHAAQDHMPLLRNYLYHMTLRCLLSHARSTVSVVCWCSDTFDLGSWEVYCSWAYSLGRTWKHLHLAALLSVLFNVKKLNLV